MCDENSYARTLLMCREHKIINIHFIISTCTTQTSFTFSLRTSFTLIWGGMPFDDKFTKECKRCYQVVPPLIYNVDNLIVTTVILVLQLHYQFYRFGPIHKPAHG